MPAEQQVSIEEEIESLKTMIRTPVSDEELRADLDRYLNRYLMDIESSKRAIIKDHGGTDEDYVPPLAEASAISGLTENDIRTVSGVVVSDIVRRRPRTKELMELTIADSTGSIPVTIWEPLPDIMEGGTYTFANCRVRFRGRPVLELNGDRVSAYTGPEIIPAVSGGGEETVIIDYSDLSEGMTDVSILASVSSIRPRSSNPRAPKQGGMLDLTGGTLEFAHWGEYELEPGATYILKKVKIRRGFSTALSATLPDDDRARKVD